MKNLIPDFMVSADNVYRTKNYIVKQILVFNKCLNQDNSITSHDTFYLRTKRRDMQYEAIFNNKAHINGKRMPSTMCSRKYID